MIAQRITLPDGRVVTRTSKRRYTHAVVVCSEFGDDHLAADAWDREKVHGRWLVAGFCGSRALADRLATRMYKMDINALTTDVRVLEVVS